VVEKLVVKDKNKVEGKMWEKGRMSRLVVEFDGGGGHKSRIG